MAATPCSSWSSWRQLVNSSRKRGSALSACGASSNGPPTAPRRRAWKRAGLRPMRRIARAVAAIALAGGVAGRARRRRAACRRPGAYGRRRRPRGRGRRPACGSSAASCARPRRGPRASRRGRPGGARAGRRADAVWTRIAATSACIWATWRSIRATSPFIASIAWKVAKADQASKTKAARTAAIWTRAPIVKRRRLLPSWRKMSRGLKMLRNLRGKAGVRRRYVSRHHYPRSAPPAGTITHGDRLKFWASSARLELRRKCPPDAWAGQC